MFWSSPFNQPIGNWDVSSVVSMNLMFNDTPFNQPLSGWNVSNVGNMTSMFQTSPFNQPIGNWDVSSVVKMANMFNNNSSFNQPIGNWDISNVNDFTGFMASKTSLTFSTLNLDNIYNGWSTKNPQIGRTITFGSAKYTSAGSAGKSILEGTGSGEYGWFITDGGI
jgi:surface protein